MNILLFYQIPSAGRQKTLDHKEDQIDQRHEIGCPGDHGMVPDQRGGVRIAEPFQSAGGIRGGPDRVLDALLRLLPAQISGQIYRKRKNQHAPEERGVFEVDQHQDQKQGHEQKKSRPSPALELAPALVRPRFLSGNRFTAAFDFRKDPVRRPVKMRGQKPDDVAAVVLFQADDVAVGEKADRS